MPVSAGVASPQLPSAQGACPSSVAYWSREAGSTFHRAEGLRRRRPLRAGLQQASRAASGPSPRAAAETCLLRFSSWCRLTHCASFFPGPAERAGTGFTKVGCHLCPDLEPLEDGGGPSVGAEPSPHNLYALPPLDTAPSCSRDEHKTSVIPLRPSAHYHKHY